VAEATAVETLTHWLEVTRLERDQAAEEARRAKRVVELQAFAFVRVYDELAAAAAPLAFCERWAPLVAYLTDQQAPPPRCGRCAGCRLAALLAQARPEGI
jgi:hypothetical protein